jgi:hypothetical protein
MVIGPSLLRWWALSNERSDSDGAIRWSSWKAPTDDEQLLALLQNDIE